MPWAKTVLIGCLSVLGLGCDVTIHEWPDESMPRPACAADPDEAGACGEPGPVDPGDHADRADPDRAAPDPDRRAPPADGAPAPAPHPSWTLTGPLVVEQACGDAAGQGTTIHVALASRCGDWTSVEAAHLQQHAHCPTGPAPRYLFRVPDGDYHLIAFVDCDGDADPSAPTPGPGDVSFSNVSSDGEDQPCRRYLLRGQGLIEMPVTLNQLVD